MFQMFVVTFVGSLESINGSGLNSERRGGELLLLLLLSLLFFLLLLVCRFYFYPLTEDGETSPGRGRGGGGGGRGWIDTSRLKLAGADSGVLSERCTALMLIAVDRAFEKNFSAVGAAAGDRGRGRTARGVQNLCAFIFILSL